MRYFLTNRDGAMVSEFVCFNDCIKYHNMTDGNHAVVNYYNNLDDASEAKHRFSTLHALEVTIQQEPSDY